MSEYHYHKECFFYSECKEEIVKQGKTELVRFTCPAGEKGMLYHRGDIHTIQIECSKFKPLQLKIGDLK